MLLHDSVADWYSCSNTTNSTPIIASAPGINPRFSGVIDRYVKTGETFNNEPTWQGVCHGFIGYWCSSVTAAGWYFSEGLHYITDRDHCEGVMYTRASNWYVCRERHASGGLLTRRQVYDNCSAATPMILCGKSDFGCRNKTDLGPLRY